MFERLNFMDIRQENFTPGKETENIMDGLLEETSKKEEMVPNAIDLSDFAAPALTADYCISGRVRYLFPKPILPEVRQAYLYIQSFSWFVSERGYFTKREGSSTYLLLYTYTGTGKLQYEGKEYLLKEGDGFFIDCRKPHVYQAAGEEWEHSDLHFDGCSAQEIFSAFAGNGEVSFHDSIDGYYQSHLEHLLRHYDRMEPLRDLLIHGELTSLLVYLTAEKEKKKTQTSTLTENIQYLVQYMQNHSAEPLTMDFLAHFTGISKYHLSREFKRVTGFSPIEYLITLRVEKAKLLLEQPGLSVRDVAEMAGFGNEQYFSRLFRQRTGCTPGQYRRLYGPK